MQENVGKTETSGPSVVVEADSPQSEPDPECLESSEQSPDEQHVRWKLNET